MNFGLIGWGIASGIGGMNSDIAQLAPWVTHWLVPSHPKAKNHQPYLDRQSDTQVIECRLHGDEQKARSFLSAVDGILYVEHPCFRDEFNIVAEARKRGKVVVGIPMWEWWPERKPWALQTDVLWAVTKFTHRYLNSLSDVLYAHGWHHAWRNRVLGVGWGVNIADFPFRQRERANQFVFVNGNGGYKLRKASDIVFQAFSLPGAPPLTVFTQSRHTMATNLPSSVTVIEDTIAERKDLYAAGDVFLFPSYWEGLCHGLYEGQASGGIVVTTDHPPMDECGTPFLVPVERLDQEDLTGKKVVKAIPSAKSLHALCQSLHQQDITKESKLGYDRVQANYDLHVHLRALYRQVCEMA